jgi:hypothetical protein
VLSRQERLELGADAAGAAGDDSVIDAGDFLDVDRAVSAYCRATGKAVPTATQAKLALHLHVLAQWIEEVRDGASTRPDGASWSVR